MFWVWASPAAKGDRPNQQKFKFDWGAEFNWEAAWSWAGKRALSVMSDCGGTEAWIAAFSGTIPCVTGAT